MIEIAARARATEPGGMTDSKQDRIRIGSATGVLAAVPHLLGFYPDRSLVVLGLGGPRDEVMLAFRYDLPDPPDPELATDIAEHACEVLSRQQVAAAIVIGYGSAELAAAAVDLVVAALLDVGVAVREALRAQGGRYWSALCRDPACCPPDGHPYDPGAHPAAAALSGAGLDAFPDRAALARTLQPEPGSARQIRQATSRALRRIDRLLISAVQAGRDPVQALARAGQSTVGEAIGRYRAGGRITDDGRLAFLAVCCADLRVRDDAWARMDPEHRQAHRRLWADVVTAAAAEFVPAPAALLAFTAWQCGEGALANVALERALAADPEYSLALLLAQAIQSGLPPSAARPPMTPQEVAASYAGPGGEGEQAAASPRPGEGQVA
jgi:hypothetical protein